jgi:hypothetical protein
METVRAFVFGFLAIAAVHLVTTCSQEGGTEPDPKPTIDVERIHQGAQAVETAFRSGSPDAVRALLTEEALAQYSSELDAISDKMPAFAEAIAGRELQAYSECYAEYRYTANGTTYSFALAAQEDGGWKLLRF